MPYKRPLKFELICEDLRSKILFGQYDEDGRLPSEETLAESFNCSRPTIRKALEKLQVEGIIYTIQGSGSYIKGPALSSSRPEAIPSDSFFGLIFPNLGSGYIFDSISNYVATYLAAKGYSLIWGGYISPHSDTFITDLNQICERYIQLGVKGVFFSPFEYTPKRGQANHSVLSTFEKAGIPVVLLDSDVDEFPTRNPFDLVSLDTSLIVTDFANICSHKGLSDLFSLPLQLPWRQFASDWLAIMKHSSFMTSPLKRIGSLYAIPRTPRRSRRCSWNINPKGSFAQMMERRFCS